MDPHYLGLLLAFEDRRFYQHRGVDPLAVLRAGYQALRHGRLVSGASTLTMQVARLIDRRHERTGFGKFRQMMRAMQLEAELSKAEILQLYLQYAPFGGNLEGVRAASIAYFGKEPNRLSLAEAALLVAIPQSPARRRPDQDPAAAERARNRVLDRAVAAGIVAAAEAERAKSEPVRRVRHRFPQFAPHVADVEVAANPELPVHRLTIDRDIQSGLEQLAGKRRRRQRRPHIGGDHCRRSSDRRGSRPRRLGRLPRRLPGPARSTWQGRSARPARR